MARPIRLEYAGAVYHVMARGNHGQSIFQDDQDRQCLLETLGQACEKTGWLIHAYVLMSNHYHLEVETPEANLVAGMKWLQGTYTQRYNSRHRLFGHLFQGRYKAVIVDGEDGEYFSTVSTYIHLNPARARLIRIGEERLKVYRWSSYPWYVSGGSQRPEWLITERVLGSLGLGPKDRKGYEAYMEGRVLELSSREGRRELEEEWRQLRRGWYVGGEGFAEKLEGLLERVVRGRRRESQSGPARRAHDESAAQAELQRASRALGISEAALKNLPKGAPEKAVLAWWLRKRTTVPLRWVSERLGMGHYTRVTQAVGRMGREAGRELKQLRRKLERLSG